MSNLLLADEPALADDDDAVAMADPWVTSDGDDVEITEAAIRGYGRLLRTVGDRLLLHVRPDGGLICEDRTRRGRPTLWLIGSDGDVQADAPYSYALGSFAPGPLPVGVAA